jgi:hypothetical protein
MLQHGSILLAGSQKIVTDVTRGPAASRGDISASELLGKAVPFERMAHAIVSQLSGGAGAPAGHFAEADTLLAEAQFHVPLYRDSAWTWSR